MRRLGVLVSALLFVQLSGCSDKHEVVSCDPAGGLLLQNEGSPVLGQPSASVEVTVFGDLLCPFTENMLLSLANFQDELVSAGKPASMKVVFRHFLKSNEGLNPEVARAIAAAHRQGGDLAVFGSAGQLGMIWCLLVAQSMDEVQIQSCAADAGLDVQQFQLDRSDEAVAALIERDVSEARRIGFDGVPGIALCREKISGDAETLIENLEYLIYR